MNDFSGKRALVTGGAGFVPSHVVDALLENGADVIAVDCFVTGRRENIAHLADNPHFKLIEADVTNPPESYLSAEELSKGFDFVFHLASPASPPRYQAVPQLTYLVNSYATHLLLEMLRKHSPQASFVFSSTSEVYGDPQVHPQPESYWGNVNPNGPRSCYDEAKRLGETICGVFTRDFGMNVRIARIFNTYGPRMDPADGRVIPSFVGTAIQQKPFTLYGDGSQTRSYCYVSDLVEGLLLLATKPEAKGQTINLGNSEEFTILQTAEIIRDHFKSNQPFEHLPLPQDDPTQRRPDISKAQQLLGWQPTVSFAEGLVKTADYFASIL